MSVLSRYKKPGGFRQLLILIETSQPVKQQKLLDVIEKEDPSWAHLIRQKKLDPNMVLTWDPNHLVIVFEHMNLRHCANIFKTLGEDTLKNYSSIFRPEKFRDLKNIVEDETAPSDNEMVAAHNHLLEIVRFLDEEKKIELRYINPALDISEAA